MRHVRDEDDHDAADAHAQELVREREQVRLADAGVRPPPRIVSGRELRERARGSPARQHGGRPNLREADARAAKRPRATSAPVASVRSRAFCTSAANRRSRRRTSSSRRRRRPAHRRWTRLASASTRTRAARAAPQVRARPGRFSRTHIEELIEVDRSPSRRMVPAADSHSSSSCDGFCPASSLARRGRAASSGVSPPPASPPSWCLACALPRNDGDGVEVT